MASPSVTYTFVNGTTSDADQVNQNFTDLINGLTDGTKSLSIDAITCAGSATLNGAVTLGNATADDLTFSGSVASNVVPKTDSTYDLGSSSLGFNTLYLGENSQRVGITASASTSATYNITLPVNAGTNNYVPATNGSGVLTWKPIIVDTAAKSAAYTVTDSDGIRTVLVTTGASNRDITLPTASDNTHRIVTVKKIDSGAGAVVVKSDAAGETIDGTDGTVGVYLYSQYDSITVQCDGSDWHVLDWRLLNYYREGSTSFNCNWNGGGAASGPYTVYYTRVGNTITFDFGNSIVATTGTSSTQLTVTTTIDSWARPSSNMGFPIYMRAGATEDSDPGFGILETGGTFRFYRDRAQTTTFPNATACGLDNNYAQSITLRL